MTDDQLDGRDLDRAVAEAMGWTRHNGPIGWCKPSGRRERCGLLPAFSTDPAALPEQLAWLKAQCEASQRLVLTDIEEGHWMASVEQWHELDREYFLGTTETGATIYEAVARLVAEIGKAKKEQGK